MEAYYRARAAEYDQFYRAPQFAADLPVLRDWLTARTRGQSILEIAAGTGYWTAVVAAVAGTITATDYNAETLAVAARRGCGRHVTLRTADAYDLPDFARVFDTAMAHLWWSHVPRRRQQDFLASLAARLKPGATLLMIDQNFVPGFSTPASRRDRDGNRYETRRLADGSTHEVIKNYPRPAQLRAQLAGFCDAIEVTRLRYFWTVAARLRG
jgi:demethylmenaquinone methyltransferase/2-methoxy-6-polyprenyl-1,4-benzoquinol methylase